MFRRIKITVALAISILTVFSGASEIATTNSHFMTASAAGNIPAFPGAVGGGKYATGGRGGEVYHVTNLNDSGDGSFRDAVSKSGRIVVFDVTGTIELKGNILCSSNITIAGQTAPGGSGITLKNYKMGMSGDNIICRYISSRPGPYASTSSGNDAWGGAKGSNSIIDHCSMGWTTDEQWGLYSNNTNYTVQYSVLGPADSWGGHKKGLHGFGIMLGKGDLTFDHNLIIHNVSRNFRGKVSDRYTADFTNNIIYDWGYQTAYGTIGHLNYVNNTLKAGNSTTGGYHWIYVDSTTKPENFKIYCAGNRLINKDGSFHSITGDNWAGVTFKDGIGITKNNLYSSNSFPINVNGENVSTANTAESAAASYDHVIRFAGNGISPDKRTAIDKQCANETKNSTGQCSGTAAFDGSETNLSKYNIKCGVSYSYPSPVTKKEITDADNDGMDDKWELARGLDPTDPEDYAGDYCGQGYMNIEYYINDLTVNSFPEGVVKLSPEQSAPLPTVSAFETIEAEDFDANEGVTAEERGNIGYIENGDWTMYRRVNFGSGAQSFKAKVSGNPTVMELYLDSISGTPAAKVSFAGTDSFTDYEEIEVGISKLSGTHDLYIRFTGGDGYLMNLDSFVFGKDTVPLSGRLFKDVQVTAQANPDSWLILPSAEVGSLLFGDRDFRIAQLQSTLEGAELLLTSCDANGTTGEAASFTAGSDMSLYIGLDSRVEKIPDWLSDYTLMRTMCSSDNDVTFMMYKKDIKTGEKVSLGSNGQTYQCVNYIVMAVEKNTTEPAVDYAVGDINKDGSINVADLVILQKHIIGKEIMSKEQAQQSDMNADTTVDIFDLVELRKAVIQAFSN
ncbi:carbohydrate-binding protein [Ruminococcus sp.]|uniref:carbohydrate-binding protein n=1 Tax=Ruminococcus sp. TaxID=41978 RepID=UPI0025F9C47B|nr:carbohydrate-binding protein [Ruminococcus sp.]MCR4637887.1 carbohydrate-binding protein [Ruminococcus sp.]